MVEGIGKLADLIAPAIQEMPAGRGLHRPQRFHC